MAHESQTPRVSPHRSSTKDRSRPRSGLPDYFNTLMAADRGAIIRSLKKLPRWPKTLEELPEKLRAEVVASQTRYATRLENLPTPDFPEELPVNQRRAEIAELIRQHQVVIVCGETGSGKTTQLPKLCLELGRGVAGLIGHTQPRRIAARATASRVATELKSPLGEAVGYKIRFTDRLSANSYIKLMTDGILLAETQTDRWLSQYDTLIIDEAHERSLNIDFLLGYLKQLLPRRPDLKVIVTSATLDAERFAQHFADANGQPAPVIEVSGRLYPIEIRYRPVIDESSASEGETSPRDKGRDLYDAILDCVDEAHREGPGDVLVFLPGEREIREAAEALRKHHPPGTEILPLFARQSAQEQAKVFQASHGRRVVLSTNVAETSLTVPGIRYVIDAGLARVKRYSARNKVEMLHIEPIAQSAARQRAGRCGRVMDGVCFRLYSEDDFNARLPHTEPEILRSSLAGVILRMNALRLGSVEEFPFLQVPPDKMIGDGYQLLTELGAVTEGKAGERELTPLGAELARLPLDPKIGRMLLAARERGCLREMLVITAALSSQDPRERSQEQPGAADQAHAKFRGGEQDQRSEFLWYWHLWQAYEEVVKHQSSSKQKAWCKANFLSWMKMREWRDVHGQLHALCAEHGWRENEVAANYQEIHKALLTGLLGHLGVKQEEDKSSTQPAGAYQGARGIKFWPHPGSSLARKAGKWIVAAELVDTSRLFARCLARIEPEWLEEVGAHLLRKQVYEPHWEKKAGRVVAWERATLHGITLYARRSVGYSDTDPALCRELFIREGLVLGELDEAVTKHMPFWLHNQRLIAEIERLEHKTRRPDVLVDEALIEAFYDALLPETVVDVPSFEAWRKKAERKNPKLLYLVRDQLMRHEAAGVTSERFPASFEVFGQKLKLTYLHEPGAVEDGVTLTVPVALLNQIPQIRCEWLVPGLLPDKVLALIKSVPPKIRHRLQPHAEFAETFCEAVYAGEWDDQSANGKAAMQEPLLKILQRAVEDKAQLKVLPEAFRPEALAAHHLMNFRVLDEHGRVLAQSRNLLELRAKFRDKVVGSFEHALLKAGVSRDEPAAKSTAQPSAPSAKNAAKAVSSADVSNVSAADNKTGLESSPSVELGEAATSWVFGELPEIMEVVIKGRSVIGFPALVEEGNGVALRVFDTPEEATKVHTQGLTRLFMLALKEQVKAIEKGLPGLRELALQYISYGTDADLKRQILAATLQRACLQEPLPVNAEQFTTRVAEAKTRVMLIAQEIVRQVGVILGEHQALTKKLSGWKTSPEAVADIQTQLKHLLIKDWICQLPWERLQHYPRYLKAAAVRLDKLRGGAARDAQNLADWQSLAKPYERAWLEACREGRDDAWLKDFRWYLEELRVSLYAQELRTPMPVSVKRLQKMWESRPR